MLKNMDTKTDLNMLKGYVVATCKRKTTKETLKNLLHCQDTSTIVRTMVKKDQMMGDL